MENKIYIPVTLFLWFLVAVLGIFVKDVGTVFDIVGAFGYSITGFFLPPYFFWVLVEKEKMKTYRENNKVKLVFIKIGCVFLMTLCVADVVGVIVGFFI